MRQLTSSKSSITAEGKKVPGDHSMPLKIPSKLSQVSHQSPDALNSVSLSDARNNVSPTIVRGPLPWLKTNSASAGKDKMAVANMIN